MPMHWRSRRGLVLAVLLMLVPAAVVLAVLATLGPFTASP